MAGRMVVAYKISNERCVSWVNSNERMDVWGMPDFSVCRRSVRAPVSSRCREVREAMNTTVVASTVGCMIVSNLNEKDLTLLFTNSITKF